MEPIAFDLKQINSTLGNSLYFLHCSFLVRKTCTGYTIELIHESFHAMFSNSDEKLDRFSYRFNKGWERG